MSADLLAGFDPYYTGAKQKSTSSNTQAPNSASNLDDLAFFDSLTSPANPHTSNAANQAHITSNEDDFGGWGDFESPMPPPPKLSTSPKRYGALEGFRGHGATKSVTLHPMRPQSMRIRAATEDFFSGKIAEIAGDFSERIDVPKAVPPPAVRNRREKPAYTPNADVLFDADDVSPDEDDEFGEFETVAEPEKKQEPQQLIDTDVRGTALAMAGMKLDPYHADSIRSSNLVEQDPFDLLGGSKPSSRSTSPIKKPSSPITPWPKFGGTQPAAQAKRAIPSKVSSGQESWDPFADDIPSVETPTPQNASWDWDASTEGAASEQKPQPAKALPSTTASITPDTPDDSWGWEAEEAVSDIAKPTAEDEAPPTNIPPPSVLMTIFPEALKSSEAGIFDPAFKGRIATDAAAMKSLKNYLSIGVTAAHVVAGRKSRWKRDTILSQAMKIGQAGIGGKSGMKLTGVDKAETAREDREVADLVRSWKEKVGRLRSAVAAANLSIHDNSEHLTVPEISETMPVRTAAFDKGALTAPKCCFLCGLKREERVLKIDTKVEDSFGEWWIDHWGHRACKDFWVRHSAKLKQR